MTAGVWMPEQREASEMEAPLELLVGEAPFRFNSRFCRLMTHIRSIFLRKRLNLSRFLYVLGVFSLNTAQFLSFISIPGSIFAIFS